MELGLPARKGLPRLKPMAKHGFSGTTLSLRHTQVTSGNRVFPIWETNGREGSEAQDCLTSYDFVELIVRLQWPLSLDQGLDYYSRIMNSKGATALPRSPRARVRISPILGIAWLLSLLAGQLACAQQLTSTQVGSASCSSRPGGWLCDPVTFPQEFGAIPSVVVSFGQLTLVPGTEGIHSGNNNRITAVMNVSLGAANITTKGFTPTVSFNPPWQSNSVSANPNGIAMHLGSVTWIAVGSTLYQGAAALKYVVMTVIYAPPGTNGGHASSSVTYGSGVTAGTTTSASQSFQTTVSTSVTDKLGFLGSGGEGSLSFDYSNKATDNQSMDIKLSTTATITRPGPAQDGIQHDEDAIFLLLKPAINLSLSSASAAWTFGDNSQSPIQYVLVGELNGNLHFRTGVLQQLQAAGITEADYPAILASDPLASGSPQLDPARFVDANWMYPYEPPATPNDPVIPVQTTISSSLTNTTGSAAENSYKVGMTLSGSLGFLGIAKGTFKDSSSWQWTNSSSVSASSTTTQTAAITIGGPGYNYPGVTELKAYRDTIFNTYAFVLVPPESLQLALKGTVMNHAGLAVAGTEVILSGDGTSLRTITNGRGEFKFYGNITGPITLKAAGITRAMSQAQPERSIELQLP